MSDLFERWLTRVAMGLALVLGIVAPTCATINDPAIIYLCDGAAGASLMDAIGNNTITATGSPGTESGQLKGARTFSGTGQYFSLTDNATVSPSGSLAISLWFKPGNNTANMYVADHWTSSGDQCHWRLIYLGATAGTTTDPILMEVCDSDGNPTTGSIQAISTAFLTAGTWYHIVGVYDDENNQVRIYVNAGTAISSVAVLTTKNVTAPVQIGAGDNGATLTTGSIDEIYYYNHALDATDVATLYGSGTPPTNPWLQKTIPVTDSNLVFSPMTWKSDGAGGYNQTTHINASSTYAITPWTGAYFKTTIVIDAGSHGYLFAVIDASVLNGLTASKCPTVKWTLSTTGYADYGTALLPYYSTAYVLPLHTTSLPAGTYKLELYFKSVTLDGTNINRWDDSAAGLFVKVLGLGCGTADATTTQTTFTNIGRGDFDSLGEGAAILGTNTTTQTNNDALLAYEHNVMYGMDAEFGNRGWGGQGALKGGNNVTRDADHPAEFKASGDNASFQSWDKYCKGANVTVPSSLDFVIIATGVNDGSSANFDAEYATGLTAMRTAYGSSVWIFACNELSGTAGNSAEISAAVTTANDAKIKYIAVPTLFVPTAAAGRWWLEQNSAHGNATAMAVTSAYMVGQMKAYMNAGGTAVRDPVNGGPVGYIDPLRTDRALALYDPKFTLHRGEPLYTPIFEQPARHPANEQFH